MKRLRTRILASVAGCVAFAATAQADTAGKEIAFPVTSPTHPFIAALAASFVEKAKQVGLETTIFTQHFGVAPSVAAGRRHNRASV